MRVLEVCVGYFVSKEKEQGSHCHGQRLPEQVSHNATAHIHSSSSIWPITQAIQPPYVPEEGQAEGQVQTHVEADYLGLR